MTQSARGGPWFAGKPRPLGFGHVRSHRCPRHPRGSPPPCTSATTRIPSPPDGWATVTVKAASLNHHDVWTLRESGFPPTACPSSSVATRPGSTGRPRGHRPCRCRRGAGQEGDETLDPSRSLLSERYDGTFAEQVTVPGEPGAQAGRPLLRGSGLPDHGLPHRLPDVVRRVRPGAGCHGPGPGRGRRVATALVLLGRADGLPGVGDRPQRGEARPGPGAGRGRGVRRPAAGCPSGSTRSWSPSARPPGRIRCAPCGRAAGSSSLGPPVVRPRPPSSTGSSSTSFRSSGPPWAALTSCPGGEIPSSRPGSGRGSTAPSR